LVIVFVEIEESTMKNMNLTLVQILHQRQVHIFHRGLLNFDKHNHQNREFSPKW